MEVGDISQDLDQAEENDLVQDIYIYFDERKIPRQLCSKQKKSHQKESGEIQSADWKIVLHVHQEEKHKGKLLTKTFSIYILFNYIHTSLIVLHTVLWEIVPPI